MNLFCMPLSVYSPDRKRIKGADKEGSFRINNYHKKYKLIEKTIQVSSLANAGETKVIT